MQENKELIIVDPKEYGLEDLTKADQVKAVFMPMIDKMKELEIKYKEIAVLPIDKETCKKAKELRLQYVKVRTGTAEIHKKAKASILAEGKFIDGWKNTQIHLSEGIEAKLEDIEKHYEKLEAEAKIKLQEERMNAYRPFSAFPEGTPDPDFTTMTDIIWNSFLAGAKKTHEDKVAAEKKAEEDRIAKEKAETEAILAKEKAEAEEKARINAENERLKKEAEEKEKQRKEELKAAEVEKQRIEAEQRKEKEKIEAELKAKQEAEEKRLQEEARIKKEKEAAEKKALNAPDKEKLLSYVQQIRSIQIPELKSEEAKTIMLNAYNSLSGFLVKLEKRSEEL